ncbi:MAG: YihY/virulence factor BrkB family protein [Opitutales bacterium]
MSDSKRPSGLRGFLARLKRISTDIQKDLRDAKRVRVANRKAKVLIFLRVLWQDFSRNRLPVSAAALAYVSLLALGPMLAIVVMVSGFILQGEGRDGYSKATTLVTELVSDLIPEGANLGLSEATPLDSAPESAQAIHEIAQSVAAEQTVTVEGAPVAASVPSRPLNPEIAELVDGMVAAASSGTLGVLGSLGLIIVVIFLLINVEKTFNTIWGVRQGRTMVQRVVFYWTLITLGSIVAFAAISLKAGEVITHQLKELPAWMANEYALALLQYVAPFLSATMMIVLLALFYRFIPNTRVAWLPALFGSVMTAFFFWVISEFSSVFLAGQLERLGAQWGSLALPLFLILSFYVFWTLILLGGQLTYATQNMGRLANQKAWENTSVQARELLSLAVLSMIARRFHACQQAPTAEEMSESLEVPGQVVNEALSSLIDMKLAVPLEQNDDESDGATRYQPCRPLERITLASFRERFTTLGVNQGADLIDDIEPILPAYRNELKRFEESERARQPLSRLLEQMDALEGVPSYHAPTLPTEPDPAVARSN